jgi:hypothetical protein
MMLAWPLVLLLLVDAVLLRILPGLEVDNWLTAFAAAVALLVGTWPIVVLTNFIGLNSTWIFLAVATAGYAVILTIVTVLSAEVRSHSALAVPVAAALLAGLNYYVAPAVVDKVMPAAHLHWF